MRKKLRRLLHLADLSEEEIRLYMQLLQLRRASATELIAKCSLKTTSAYRVLKRLQEQGLVTAKAINGKQVLYEPLSLSALTKKLAVEQRKLRRLELALQDLDPYLPYLDDGEAEGAEPIEVLDNLEEITEHYFSLPALHNESFLGTGSFDHFWQMMGFSYGGWEEKQFIESRMRNNLHAHLLCLPSEDCCRAMARRDAEEKRTSRFLASQTKSLFIIGDDVATLFLHNQEHPRCLVMRQPELVQLHRQNFKQMWDSAAVV